MGRTSGSNMRTLRNLKIIAITTLVEGTNRLPDWNKFRNEGDREYWKITKQREVPSVKNQQTINHSNRITKEIWVRIVRIVIQSIESKS